MDNDTPVYAVEITSAPADIVILAELLETLDLPPTAVSSYENVETKCGTTFILCDTPAEQASARAQVDTMLPLWQEYLNEPLREIRNTEIKREDWSESWKKYFHTFRASQRLVIKPSWEEFQAEPQDILLEIDPGMCFGTGSHGTTKGCLVYLDEIALEQNAAALSVIDAGCGSGILSIAARKLGYDNIYAFDYDPQAVKVSKENFELAGIKDIPVEEGDVHDIVPPFQADVVLANILAHILVEAREHLLTLVRPGGTLILSGILEDQYPGVKEAFAALGCREIDNRTFTPWISGKFIVP